MNGDTVKTFVGLVIIGGIVVATFMYGNSQRQSQLKHDQDVKKQTVTRTPVPTHAATITPTPFVVKATPTPAVTSRVATNTAPVKRPASTSLQGSGGTGTTLGASATASPTPAPIPTTGGSALPQTGPGTMGVIGFSLIGAMMLAVRGSRRALMEAARARR